ncbi:ABC transporter permease subunit [Aquitalea sp. S1-19]|uniref:ABC transporter permease subunit n=1 Tax=Craterilacuibacter sinensis TaxID=2686017 RepID=A0A845BI43_9NEIS|nr:ABC transporter permease subunit [Craterilacuibacter sinensis]MCP9758356.1 ABC transporter permease subunit [Aquitalea sp. S1-19]MXR35965.1 ABC transporter permease subunit [Craterilacuibacter sinensis]
MMQRFGAWPALTFIGLFFVLPLLALVPEAVSENGAAFGRMLADPLFWPALTNSVLLGLSAGVLSTLVGVAVAWQLAQASPFWRDKLMALLGLPLAFSGMVIAYGFILAFGRAGFVTQILGYLGADTAEIGGWVYTVGGLTFAYAYYLIPRVALTLYPVFANLDLRPIEAARTLGATPRRAFLDVVVPEVGPSVLGSCAVVSALAMGTYGTALALVGTQVNILPLLLYAKIGDGGADFPVTSALSIILLALCSLVLGLGDHFSQRREHATFE